jgi:hypothetical protein
MVLIEFNNAWDILFFSSSPKANDSLQKVDLTDSDYGPIHPAAAAILVLGLNKSLSKYYKNRKRVARYIWNHFLLKLKKWLRSIEYDSLWTCSPNFSLQIQVLSLVNAVLGFTVFAILYGNRKAINWIQSYKIAA